METKLPRSTHAYVLSSEEHKGATLIAARTPDGNLPLKLWRPENRERPPRPGDYILLETTDPQAAEEELARWRSISLDSKFGKEVNCTHTVVPEDEVPPEVRRVINRDRKPQILAALELLEDPTPWKDGKLHQILLGFVEENRKRLLNAPAATSRHHNWRGGLLVHTAEVAGNCIAVLGSPMNRFYREKIDGDALQLAAWLHDSGKMETYRMDGEKPAIDGELEERIGHPTISNLIFSELARKHALEREFSLRVSHCILSHHGKRAWGAVVRPRTPEARILSRADYISSRMPD